MYILLTLFTNQVCYFLMQLQHCFHSYFYNLKKSAVFILVCKNLREWVFSPYRVSNVPFEKCCQNLIVTKIRFV